MSAGQAERGAAFLALHRGAGAFLMPNAWNAGSARLLEAAGFAALATTSAGIAYARALPDATGALDRDAALAETARIAGAVALPVSVDAENGYGDDPEAVAETIRGCVAAGAVGAGIEDYTGDPARPFYDPVLAGERIAAARAAADASGVPFTLTARAECFLYGHPEPFAESVARLNRYREAGADCLYAPGVRGAGQIGALVREVDGPVNVLMGLGGERLSVAELEDLGVRRVSIGGALARACFGLVRRAAAEMHASGTFSFVDGQIPDAELTRFFEDSPRRGGHTPRAR